MTDQKPPKHVADERTTLLALLQFQRESVLRKVDGVSEDEARHSPVASGTTLLWLVKHLGRAECIWVQHRFAGTAMTVPDDTVSDADSLTTVIAGYRASWADIDAIVATSSLEDQCANPEGDPQVNLRWILMHLLEETARHAGHADILRELIDGDTGR
jgi:hypothetical protein